MRLVVVALGLAVSLSACGGRDRAPAWPKAAATDDDGGESLAPRQVAAVALEEADEPVVEAAPEAAATPDAPAADAPDATPTAPVITAPEEVINLDDIVIEIEEE